MNKLTKNQVRRNIAILSGWQKKTISAPQDSHIKETKTTYWRDGYFNTVRNFIFKHSHTNGFQVYYQGKYICNTKKLKSAKSIIEVLELDKIPYKQKPY